MSKKSIIILTACLLLLLVGVGAFAYTYYKGTTKLKASYNIASDTNSVIPGGVNTVDELRGGINAHQGEFHTVGIYAIEIPPCDANLFPGNRQLLNGSVDPNGNVLAEGYPSPVATGVYTAGRERIDGCLNEAIGGLWYRPATCSVNSSLPAFIYMIDGKFSWGVIKSCGNPIVTWGPTQIDIQKKVQNLTTNTGWQDSVAAKNGDQIQYHFWYRVNDGSGPLQNVILKDWFTANLSPKNGSELSNRQYLQFLNSVPPANCNGCWATWADNQWNWISPGKTSNAYSQAFITAQVIGDPPNGTVIKDDACVEVSNPSILSCSNPVSIIVEKDEPIYGLTIQKNVAKNNSNDWQKSIAAVPGETIQYKITYTSTGTELLENIVIKDTLPQNVTYEGPDDFRQIIGDGYVIGSLQPGRSGEIVFQVKISDLIREDITLENCVTATANNITQQRDCANVVVDIINALAYNKKADNITRGIENVNVDSEKSREGDRIEYTLTTINNGNVPENVLVSDDISDILQYATVTDLGGGTLNGTIIQYPEASIPAGQRIENTFIATIKSHAEWPTEDELTMTNVYGDTVNVPLGFTNILQSKFAFNETQNILATENKAKPGDVIRYTLEVTNTGNIKAEEYTIEEDLSDILQYADVTEKDEDATIEGNKIRWIVDIESNGRKTARSFKVTIKDSSAWPLLGDLIMSNVYGNTIDIPIEPQSVAGAVIAPMVLALTATGTAILLIVLFALVIVVIYIVIRALLARKKKQ